MTATLRASYWRGTQEYCHSGLSAIWSAVLWDCTWLACRKLILTGLSVRWGGPMICPMSSRKKLILGLPFNICLATSIQWSGLHGIGWHSTLSYLEGTRLWSIYNHYFPFHQKKLHWMTGCSLRSIASNNMSDWGLSLIQFPCNEAWHTHPRNQNQLDNAHDVKSQPTIPATKAQTSKPRHPML